MDYLLKSTICLTAFYGLYFFGFRRLSFHTLNRFYLLVSLALSLTIPLLSYERTEVITLEPQPIEETTFPVEEMQENTYNQSLVSPQITSIEESPDTTIDWMQLLNTIYLLGVGLMIFLFLKNLLTIFFAIKKASASLVSCGTPPASLSQQKLKILMAEKYSNSSFFNYVFLNPDKLNPHEEALIIAHEGFHAQRLHTLDLLLLGILKAIFWFNPIIYFYQKSLKQIHEYEVDALMSATHDGREYAHLLLKLGVAPSALTINQFSTKPLSERIQFLFKTPTKNMKKLLYFLSVPLITVGIMAFAEEKVVRVYQEKTQKNSISKRVVEAKVLSEKMLQKQTRNDTLGKEKITKIDSSRFSYTYNAFDFKFSLSDADSFKLSVDNKLLIQGKDYIVKNNKIILDNKYKGKKTHLQLYGKPTGSIIYPDLTKLNKVEFPDMRFSSKTPVFLAKNENSSLFRYTTFQTRPSTPFSKVAKNQDTLRTILETNKLGKNPIVIINSEEYPSSVLYRINPDNTRGYQMYSKGSQRAVEKYGLRAEDGVVILNTVKNKELLLENEKQYRIAIENVKKQLEAPKKRVQRVVLKDLDGKEYEKVSVMRPDLTSIHFSVDVPVGGKVLFTVNGKVVSEESVENAKQIFIGGGCGKTHGEKYDAYIDLNEK